MRTDRRRMCRRDGYRTPQSHREKWQVIPNLRINPLTHYCNDSSNAAWLEMCRAEETAGERTPAQTEPHEVVMDASTPSLLRKQAA